MTTEGMQLSHTVGVPSVLLWLAAISLRQRESQDLRLYYKSDGLDFFVMNTHRSLPLQGSPWLESWARFQKLCLL